ncbi:uncharacterized protein LOC134824622 isoform X4 [Bolinopsis microptera]|uniref:uncharacterized protein LOC134824622 isoform X4 n=1 Tax=Bolinopsis microptera TaxID=2820187 RepID=UPI00307A54C1
MPAEVEPPGWILKSWNCSFELSNVTTTFGKEDSDCLIPFRSVSKHHAVIAWDPRKQNYKIKEAPFSLGTFVNDSRIGVRTIVITLGDTIRFGADSPTFRVEVKEKEKEIISPRKTLSTVHDIEKEESEDWPERTQNQTVVSNNKPFVVTPIAPSPQLKHAPRAPATKITSYEPPDLRDESPLLRASRDLSMSRTSIDDLRNNRASTPSSASRPDNKRPIRMTPHLLNSPPRSRRVSSASVEVKSTTTHLKTHRRTSSDNALLDPSLKPSAKSRDNVNKSREGRRGSRDSISQSRESPHKSRESPHKSRESPHKSRESPHKSRESPHKSRESPHKSRESPHKSRESPHKSRESPHKSRESPHKSREGRRGSRDSLQKSRESLQASPFKQSPVMWEILSERSSSSPGLLDTDPEDEQLLQSLCLSDTEEHSPKNEEHSPENEEHSPENEEHSPENEEHSPENEEHSSENEEHSPENEEHSPENEEHSSENEEHSPENEEYSPENEEHSSENEEYSPENEEHSSENEELCPEDEEDSSEDREGLPDEEDSSEDREGLPDEELFEPLPEPKAFAFVIDGSDMDMTPIKKKSRPKEPALVLGDLSELTRFSSKSKAFKKSQARIKNKYDTMIDSYKGPKGSALYGQPTWWGEEEDNSHPPSTPDIVQSQRRTPRHSHSTEFDPFDGYSDRHDFADYPTPRESRDNGHRGDRDNGYRGDRDNGSRSGGFPRERKKSVTRREALRQCVKRDKNLKNIFKRSYNGNHGNHDSPARPTSGFYEDDKYSERSYDRNTDRSYPPVEERRNNRNPPQPRFEERVYTPPPSKPGMAFQITFDEPKSSSPRHPGKKKKGTPPKPDNENDKKSNVSVTSDRSRKSVDSNRSSEKQFDRRSDKNSDRHSDKGSDKGSDMKIDDIELSLPDEPSNEEVACRSDEEVSVSSGSLPDVHMEDPAIKKELTKWANSMLKTKDYVPVFSIHDSMKDGRTLAQLLHSIADERVSDLNKDPKLRVEILPNIDKCLAFSKQNNLMVGDIASRDIVKGNELQITILLEQLRAAHKRKLESGEMTERPAVPKPDESKDPLHTPNLASASNHTLSSHTLSNHTLSSHTLSNHMSLENNTDKLVTSSVTMVTDKLILGHLDWNLSQTWLKYLVSEAELTDEEGVLPFRRNKTMAAPPRSKRSQNHTSSSLETGDKPTDQIERMLLHTLNTLTQQLKSKIDKSAVYSLHIKEELDSLAGNNAPEDFAPNSMTGPPPPGSDNNAIPDSEITEALKNLRFLERKLTEIEENLVHVRNETIPTLAKKGMEKPKKKKKEKDRESNRLSGMFRSKDSSSKDSLSNLKSANSVASINSINSLSDSGLASVGGGPPGSVTNEKANIVT